MQHDELTIDTGQTVEELKSQSSSAAASGSSYKGHYLKPTPEQVYMMVVIIIGYGMCLQY